jgi:hypothetical protein
VSSKLDLSTVPQSDAFLHGGITLIASGLTPLFMDTAAGRAMIAAPNVPDHETSLTIHEPGVQPIVISGADVLGNLKLTVANTHPRVTQENNRPLSANNQYFLNFDYIVDLEKLYGTAVIKDFSGTPSYLYLNDGRFSTYQLRSGAVTFYVDQNGDEKIVETKSAVAERIAVQSPFDEGAGATLIYANGAKSFDFKAGRNYVIDFCNFCDQQSTDNDFNMLYWACNPVGGVVRTTAAIQPILAREGSAGAQPRLSGLCVPAFFGRTISF